MSFEARPFQKTISAANQVEQFSALNLSTFAFSVAGTIGAGNIVVQGSGDGLTWTTLTTYTPNTPLASNQIIAAGNYRCSIAGLAQVRLLASGAFTGPVNISGNASSSFFFSGVGEGIDSLTVSLPLSSTGGSDPVVSILGLSTLGSALQVMGVNAGATAMEWNSSTGTTSIVRAASPTLTGTIALNGLTLIGTTTQPFSGSTPQLLVVNTTDGSVMFTDNVTNATNKYFRILLAPRTNSATANMVLEAENGASSFLVNLGGGIGGHYAATNGQFWAAANNTTTTGTNVGGWDVNGIRATTLGVSGIGTRISAFANTPYLGYNAMYDVADSRYEYGLNSSSQYAAYSQLNASTGAWSLNISTSAGNAAGAITSAAVITAVPTGTVTIGGATPIITMLAGDLKSGVNTSNVRVMGGNSSSDGGYILYGGNARAGDRMQYVLPSTWSAGTNAHVFYVNASIEGLRIQAVGASGSVSGSTVTIPSLQGSGSRPVVADANGVLSAP
jgi:hypothetical protein